MRSAALVLTAAAAILALSNLTHRANTPAPEPLPAADPARVLGTATAQSSPEPAASPTQSNQEGDVAVGDTAAPAAATRVGRDFLASYLRWEDGDQHPAVTAALHGSASPGLWRLLNSSRGQPRTPGTVTRAELQSLIKGAASSGDAATIAANLQRGTNTTGLALVVRKIDGRWQVTSVQR